MTPAKKAKLTQALNETTAQVSATADELAVSVEALSRVFDKIHAAGAIPEWPAKSIRTLSGISLDLEDIQAQCVFLRSVTAKLYSKSWEAQHALGRDDE